MWWTSSSGNIELWITEDQANKGHHRGACDYDIEELLQVPGIAKQIDHIAPSAIAAELSEYGAWDDDELQDHEENKARLLWTACGDITERESR